MTPEVIPPRVPQYNWVDLGLPSGTLWLDRLVGAPSPSDLGLFYQWGDIVGHSIEEGYDFNSANYEAKGLNLISGNLDSAHDAARAYYGPKAKIPSSDQYQELADNCAFSFRDDGLIVITSNINGAAITIPPCGKIQGQVRDSTDRIRAWSSIRGSAQYAYSLDVSAEDRTVTLGIRAYGEGVMAVHS